MRTHTATLHTVAIRSRARVPRGEWEAIVQGAIDLVSRREPPQQQNGIA